MNFASVENMPSELTCWSHFHGRASRFQLSEAMVFAHEQYDAYNVRDYPFVDHTYSKPWHTAPNTIFRMPARFLLSDGESSLIAGGPAECGESDDEIDVGVEEPIAYARWTPSVHPKSFQESLQESWSNAAVICSVHPDDTEERDWERDLNRISWSSEQRRLFEKLIVIIDDALLGSRCSLNADKAKTSLRLHIDEAAKRLRGVFASVEWKPALLQWLHTLMMENAGYSFLAIYLEIIQTLRSMVPLLMERVIQIGIMKRAIPPEAFNFVLRKPWEAEALPVLPVNKKRNVSILVLEAFAQQAATLGGQSACQKRQGFWNDSLQQLGRVILVTPSLGNGLWTVKHYVESMENALQTKIIETRQHLNMVYQSQKHSSRIAEDKNLSSEELKIAPTALNPIVLVGWNTGAAVCAQMAKKLKGHGIAALVCLGFPTCTLIGKRCQPDDSIWDLDCNTLFVIGENAANVRLNDLETMRENMKGSNSLLVVGGADEHLLVSKAIRMREKLTQSAIDTMIINEISRYLEATIDRQQRPFLGALSAPQEDVAMKAGDGSGLKSTVGASTFGPHRTGHLSFDQPFSAQRFGSARAGSSAGTGPTSTRQRDSVPSSSGADTGLSAGPSSGVPGLTTGDLVVDQERLDSAIASILGDSGKDDTDLFLSGFDDPAPLLDINVGDAASAAATLAAASGTLDTGAAGISPMPQPFSDPFLGGLPSVSSASSSSASSLMPAAGSKDSASGFGKFLEPAPSTSLSRKRVRQTYDTDGVLPAKAQKLDKSMAAPLKPAGRVTGKVPTSALPRGMLMGSADTALHQFAVPPARMPAPLSKPARPLGVKKPSTQQQFRFSVTPGGMLRSGKVSVSEPSTSFGLSLAGRSTSRASAVVAPETQLSTFAGSSFLANNVVLTPSVAASSVASAGTKMISLGNLGQISSPVTFTVPLPPVATTTAAALLSSSVAGGGVGTSAMGPPPPTAGSGAMPIRFANLGQLGPNVKVMQMPRAVGGLGAKKVIVLNPESNAELQKLLQQNPSSSVTDILSKFLPQTSAAQSLPSATSTAMGNSSTASVARQVNSGSVPPGP